jgi:hypothetical protein
MRSDVARLVEFIHTLQGFRVIAQADGCYDHMGATLIDAVFQAGINYDNVVRARVERIRTSEPEARTTSGLSAMIAQRGASSVVDWREGKKTRTLRDLIDVLRANNIETESDLRIWMTREESCEQLKRIKGIGKKTIDYLKILCGLETVAVDRHLQKFVIMAGLPATDYDEIKNLIVEAADVLSVPYSHLDHSIWRFMSTRERGLPNQTMQPTCRAGC